MKETYLIGIMAAVLTTAVVSSGISSVSGRSHVPSADVTAQPAAPAPAPAPAPEASVAAVDFSGQIQPVFEAACVMCHQGEFASANLVLEAEALPESLVGAASTQADMLLVAPGDPGASYLMHKLEGTHQDVGGMGSQMPMGGALTDEQIALVSEWIEGLQ